jgi:hypothetical protein
LFQNLKARADFIGASVAVYEALPDFVKRFALQQAPLLLILNSLPNLQRRKDAIF